MKTQMKNMVRNLTTALILTLSAGSIALANDGGDGRSGDDQSGVSIPVRLDRGLRMDSFSKAAAICRDQAAASLISQLVRQPVQIDQKFVHTGSPGNSGTGWAGNVYRFSLANGDSYKPFGIFLRVGQGNIGPHFIISSRWESILGPKDFMTVNPEIYAALNTAQDNNATFVGGIHVNLETQKDSGYDDLGNYREELLIIKKYTVIQLPILRRLSNEHTQPTKLTLSAQDFKECLQNQLN